MGIEVTFAQVEPTASQSANDLMYRKTTVRSTSPVPIVSLKPTASISYKTEVQPVVTVKPMTSIRTSSEQAPVRTLTTTVSTPETQADPAAGGAEGGQSVPTLRPDKAAERYVDTIPAPFVPEVEVPSDGQSSSRFPWGAVVGSVGFLFVLGIFLRKKR